VLAAAKQPPVPAEPEPAPAVAPPPSTPAPAAEPAGTPGILHITVKGAWADVWVDGKMLGRVPPMHRYTLPAGEHVLELRNPGLKPLADTILITPGETLPYTRLLQPMTPPPSSP
jgi:serine/threonine-protein kinase